jgi:hypothetical protein
LSYVVTTPGILLSVTGESLRITLSPVSRY